MDMTQIDEFVITNLENPSESEDLKDLGSVGDLIGLVRSRKA